MTQRLATEWLVFVACFATCAVYGYVAPHEPNDMLESVAFFPIFVAPLLYLVVGAVRLTIAAVRALILPADPAPQRKDIPLHPR